jgi:ABC-type transporter Mla MlaB component
LNSREPISPEPSIAKIKRETRMLKITRTVLSKNELTLQLDGRVTGRWVELLQESAQSALEEGVIVSVDLKNVYFIDCEGIALLKSLINRGVQPVNAPLFVVEQIKKCQEV